jgi:hypothetical protein
MEGFQPQHFLTSPVTACLNYESILARENFSLLSRVKMPCNICLPVLGRTVLTDANGLCGVFVHNLHGLPQDSLYWGWGESPASKFGQAQFCGFALDCGTRQAGR